MSIKVILSISTLTGGGAEHVVSLWANDLASLGYDVYVLLAGRTNNEYKLSSAVKVVSISQTYDEYKNLSRWKQLFLRRRIIKTINPDYIISFLPYNQILTLITTIGLSVRRIETVRISPWHASINGSKIGRWLWLQCFKHCYATIVQSEEQKAFFPKKIQEKCIAIPNPIDDSYLNMCNYKIEKRERLKFVAVGRIAKQKNYRMMIEAFSNVINRNLDNEFYSESTLEIYGAEDGDLVKDLLDLVFENRMEHNIFFKGRTNNIQNVYSKSDVFLMASDFEGMPNALVEAMASGLVCISTDCKTGPKELIDDNVNGFLVPTGNVIAYEKEIEKVMKLTENEKTEIGEQARMKIIDYCSKKNSLEKLKSILK